MSFAVNAVFNPKIVAQILPPNSSIAFNLEVTVQAATAQEMTARTRLALADIQRRNEKIVAETGSTDLKLTITDVTLSGAGDGHTFTLVIFFSPMAINPLAEIFSAIFGGPLADFSPENWDFEFALAGTAEALAPLYTPLLQAVCDAAAIKNGGVDPEELLTLFNLNAGAAKGTRFMAGIGAFIGQVVTAVRNPVDSTTVPAVANASKFQQLLAVMKKTQPAGSIASSSSMMNLLGLKR